MATPRLYLFAVKFQSKKRATPLYYRTDETPGPFDQHFNAFQNFFKIKTGNSWDKRLLKASTMDASLFRYTPPVSCLEWY